MGDRDEVWAFWKGVLSCLIKFESTCKIGENFFEKNGALRAKIPHFYLFFLNYFLVVGGGGT